MLLYRPTVAATDIFLSEARILLFWTAQRSTHVEYYSSQFCIEQAYSVVTPPPPRRIIDDVESRSIENHGDGRSGNKSLMDDPTLFRCYMCPLALLYSIFCRCVYSCSWTVLAEPGQHIVVSWRLSTAGSWRSAGTEPDDRGPAAAAAAGVPGGHRKSGPCPVTLVFVDGFDLQRQQQQSGASGPGAAAASPSSTTSAFESAAASRYDVIDPAIHVTTCSVGSRDEPRVIYASRTNRIQIRPTDAMLARLEPDSIDDVNWKPHLLEYQSE